ncbi:MAG: glycosyltransferase family 39 protein [Planctomycetes bacterium]|nr:glycosyltransferase family 39 protein [Planctomycetota bacterium]
MGAKLQGEWICAAVAIVYDDDMSPRRDRKPRSTAAVPPHGLPAGQPDAAHERAARGQLLIPVCVVLVSILAAYLRLVGLGDRSLWLDEFATWHVSQMPLRGSLRWAPELTKPPLYQLLLRLISNDPHPPEWLLRLPAAIAGALVVPAAYWMARHWARAGTALALAALLACNELQVEYGREARSYSMLVLGSVLSMTFWHRLLTRRRAVEVAGYVAATAIAIHSSYLAVLTFAAQALWLVSVLAGGRARRRGEPATPAGLAATALAAAGVLCAPLAVHYLRYSDTVFQGLGWIPAPTWSRAWEILARLTFGGQWLAAILAPALVVWLLARAMWRGDAQAASGDGGLRGWLRPVALPGHDVCGLLLWWLGCAWFGLVVISWLRQPVLVDRYALPAGVSAILLPLIIAERLHRRAALWVAAVFFLGTAPDWATRHWDVRPGFRELVTYVREHADPATEAVVQVIDNATYPGWSDMERLAFRYYPLEDRPVYELELDPKGGIRNGTILDDPRALYLIVFRADPFPIIAAAGRRAAPMVIDGVAQTQLLFQPYRLARVEPLSP